MKTEKINGYVRCVRNEEIKSPTQEWSDAKKMTWYEVPWYAKSLGDGWRVPTIEELNKAYENKVEGFASGCYWSSSECNSNYACILNFNLGGQDSYYKSHYYPVRCVREANDNIKKGEIQ